MLDELASGDGERSDQGAADLRDAGGGLPCWMDEQARTMWDRGVMVIHLNEMIVTARRAATPYHYLNEGTRTSLPPNAPRE